MEGLKEKRCDIGFCSKMDNEPLIEFTPIARQELKDAYHPPVVEAFKRFVLAQTASM